MTKRFNTIDGETLMTMPLKPINFIINNLLSEGLHILAGSLKNNEDLWLEVANYLEESYELDKVKKIYLSGDGASWIKEGLNWIVGSEYVLDYFHLCKYIRIATAHMPEYFHKYIWKYIDNLDKKSVLGLLNVIIEETDRDTKKKAVVKSKTYILNNWESRYLKALRGA